MLHHTDLNLLDRHEYFDGRSIALVGNGPVKSEFGEKIDSSDIVIRFNNYNKGFEKHIGNKISTYCFWWNPEWEEIIKHRLAKVDVCCLVHLQDLNEDLSPKNVVSDCVKKVIGDKLVLNLGGGFEFEMTQELRPTSGIILLSRIVDTAYKSLFICGFNFMRPKSGKLHIWQESPDFRFPDFHQPEFEEQLFNKLLSTAHDVEVGNA